MRKFTSLLVLSCAFAGMAWGQQEDLSIIGITEMPASSTTPASIETGYYLLEEVNPGTLAAGKACGYLKAVSETTGSVAKPSGGSGTLTADAVDQTYIWYIEKQTNGNYTISSANKVIAWDAPNQQRNIIVDYDSRAELTFATQAVTLDGKSATPVDGSFIVQDAAGTSCVHYGNDTDLGSWTDANPASVMMFKAYQIDESTLVRAVPEVAAWKRATLASLGYVGSYDTSLRDDILAVTTTTEMEAFIAAHTLIALDEGYYYIKGTGTGNEATWYAAYGDNKTDFKAMNFDETDKLKYVWKLEAVSGGYRMKSCNLNKYAKLDNASTNGSGSSEITSDNDDYFTFTNNGACRHTIRNKDNHYMRTENTGEISYWDTENNETWYLVIVRAEDLAMNVTVGSTGYATAYLPVDVALPENNELEAYIVTEANNARAKMTQVDYIKAHQGVILKGTAKAYTLAAGEGTADFTDNKLRGTIFDTNIADESYVLANGASGVAFYIVERDQAGNTFRNNARKAYLPVSALTTGEGDSRCLTFDFGGTETGIENIEGAEGADAVIYDLSGRRVQNAQKGIYIVNGKKIIR